MKVFIRNTNTGWYFQEPSKWTRDQAAATDLGQVARTVERIFEAHLENVEILLSYDEPRYDLVLPVPPSPSRRTSSARQQPDEEGRRPEGGHHHLPRKKRPPL